MGEAKRLQGEMEAMGTLKKIVQESLGDEYGQSRSIVTLHEVWLN